MTPREPILTTGPSDRFGRLLFVFSGRARPWTSLQGVEVPEGMVWEARAYPSLEYAIGESWEEAKANLRELLDVEIKRAERADQWYSQKLSELSPGDRQALHAVAFQVVTSQEEGQMFQIGSHDTFVVDDVQNGADALKEASCPGQI